MTFPQAPYSATPTGSRITLHWTRSQFFFYWETNVTNLDLLKMKSVTKTLQAPSPTSTKASAWPDPSFFSPQKNNHVKNLGSTSGLLSHTAIPYTPPSIDTPQISRLGLRPKEGIVRFPGWQGITAKPQPGQNSKLAKEDRRKTGLPTRSPPPSHPRQQAHIPDQ